MGYVHDVAMVQWVAPNEILNSAGTWTQKETATADVWCVERTAAAATWNSYIPIRLPQNSVDGKGSKLVSIELGYVILTDVMTSVTPLIYKVTKQVHGTAPTVGLSMAFAADTGHGGASDRVDIDEHWVKLTPTVSAWLDHDDYWFVEIAVSGTAAGVFEWLGARINYTLRV